MWKLLLGRDVHVLMSKGRLAHAASLERIGCWRWDKGSLTQNSVASAQPLLMSHFDVGTFLQYSCLQIRVLTCTVGVLRDRRHCFQHCLQEQGVQVLPTSGSTYGAFVPKWHQYWKWPNLPCNVFLLKNTHIHRCSPHRSWIFTITVDIQCLRYLTV